MEEDFAIKQEEAEIRELLPILYDIGNMIDSDNFWHAQHIDVSVEDNYFSAHAQIINQPYGLVLILGSLHSELDSILKPLIGAIAAGNCCIIVPNIGEKETRTDALLARILRENLDPSRVLVLDHNDLDLNELILQNNVDLVFTSQEPEMAQPLHQFCAEHGVPIKKHTNGLNIALIEEMASIRQAAQDLALNKFYKSGQHTANLDIIYVHEKVYEDFLIEYKDALFNLYNSSVKQDIQNHGKIVNKKEYSRIIKMLKASEHGGEFET